MGFIMTKSKIFLYLCLSFIGGIFLSSLINFSQLPMLGVLVPYLLIYAGLIFGIILISILWKYKTPVVIGFCLIFLAIGIWRYQIIESRIKKSELKTLNDKENQITLVGIVSEEPDIKGSTIGLTISAEKLITGGPDKKISGKILATTDRYPEYKYGDVLKITGKLKAPSEDINGFNYANYLSKDGVYSTIEWPKIELAAENQGNILYKTLFF